MNQPQVFEDSSGRRKTLLAWLAGGLLLTVSLVGTIFLLSLGAISLKEPHKVIHHLVQGRPLHDRLAADFVLRGLEREFAKQKTKAAKAPVPKNGGIVLGYFAPWQSTGLASFRAHAGRLTHLAPAWFHLSENGRSLDQSDFDLEGVPANKDVLKIARQHGVKVEPLVSNAFGSQFSGQRTEPLLSSSIVQDSLLSQLVKTARMSGFRGYQFDFEGLDAKQQGEMTSFLQKAHLWLHEAGLELSTAVEASTPPGVLAKWAEACDFVVLMTYDEHSETDSPGPIASLPWFEDRVDAALDAVPPEKLVAGIGSYAYDWKNGQSQADSISFQEAMADAAGYRDEEPPADVISLDAQSLNSTFSYTDDEGGLHHVWMLDAISAYNQALIVSKRRLAGSALWVLGTEDPQIWEVFGQNTPGRKPDYRKLEKISYPFEVTFTGKGEALSVLARPSQGKRRVTLDDETGMIDSVTYDSYPTTYVIRKSGYKPRMVALTFDDGPDPEWTPKILDILKQKGAPAAFFVVGQNVEANPLLAERIVLEGHEIGSHTFTHPNLGSVDQARTDFELSAAQRVIESATGRSTLLFRPPYNADSQPETAEEVRPVDRADQLGYVTVGENIDPNDWQPTILGSDGNARRRTGDDIVRLIAEDVDRKRIKGDEGNIILLHDAGGDRAATVEALPKLIDTLRAKGYQITSLSDLLGRSKSSLMPAIPPQEAAIVGVDRLVFTSGYVLQTVIFYGFLAAIFLGALKAAFVLPMAVYKSLKKRAPLVPRGSADHDVTVLIAAYNEEKTICSTISSVLASTYPIREIIVINDGSTDGTSRTVQDRFGSEPRVRLIEKPNGGKASALNLGIEQASGSLLFCIDADTRVNPDAVSLMAARFVDPRIAAVAGNVEVGNVNNLLTIWQSIEYRTSQHLERRAYEAINSIVVVPGAIGMWNKEALVKAGGYCSDTLAEDMDLTWRLRNLGFTFATETRAVAWTEAPETWGALFKQRFRWSYGTVQCLWKHRSAIAKSGWFGAVVMPFMVVFQIVFQLLGPLVDIQLLLALVAGLAPMMFHGSREVQSAFMAGPFMMAMKLYALFFLVEFVSGLIACFMDRANPLPLVWLVLQRFAYRQLMYLVMLKSLWHALIGSRQGWGKLRRTGSAA